MNSSARPDEEESCLEMGFPDRRSRKTGSSHIFSGVNIQQLQRLFHSAGDRDAEHRARLVWRGEGQEEGQEEEEETQGGVKGAEGSEEEEAGLAQALVSLRICARTKAGLRAETHSREQRWSRTHQSLQIKRPSSANSVMDKEATTMTSDFPFLKSEKMPEKPNKSSSWRTGVVRHETVRDSEHYLHQILH